MKFGGQPAHMTLNALEATKRLKFDPSCPRAWKSTGELIIGFSDCANSKPLLIASHQKEISTWIGLLDGTRNLEDLMLTGSAMGIEQVQLMALLDELMKSGHVYSVENFPVSENSAHLATNLKCDARLNGTTAANVVKRRQALPVLVEGSGQCAFALMNALSEVQLATGWRPMNSQRIRAEEVPRNLDPNNFVNQKWTSFAKPIPNPRLVFSLNESHDFAELENSYSNAVVVPVTVHARRFAIGPILGAVNSACANCLHELRKRNDADWALLTIQAIHQKRALPIISERWLNNLVSLCVNIAVEFAEFDQIVDLTNASLELTPPNPIWQLRKWGEPTKTCEHLSQIQNGQIQNA
ncbi:MAG: hypothetical protein RLZZ330_728 [Actinomycetota bacterium]|jgi:hypothetical protein